MGDAMTRDCNSSCALVVLPGGDCTHRRCLHSDGSDDSGGSAGGDAFLSDDAAEATFETRPSMGQVTVTGTEAGTEITLFDQSGQAVESSETDSDGALIFREVEPGTYRVATTDGDDQVASGDIVVPTEEESLPEQDFYEGQTLEPGYTYIETRDGT